MKYIIPIFLSLLILSCSKDYKVLDKINSVSFKLNGEKINVSLESWFPYSNATIQDSNKFDIFMGVPHAVGDGYKYFIGIGSIIKKLDKQIVTAVYDPLIWNDSTIFALREQRRKVTNASFRTTITGGDSQCEKFIPDTTDKVNNWVRNTSEQGNFKVVKGEFNLKLIKVADCPDRNTPDTIYITEGKYQLYLEE